MKDKIVTFGEIMLRLSPENNARFTQCNAFEAVYGGGEANTAVSLANFDVDANYVTKLPKHIIGQAAINSLRQYGVGVDISCVAATRLVSTSLRRRQAASN